jgi:hypothetical protein
MLNWLTRRATRPARRPTAAPSRAVLRFEALEARELPAITIDLNYSHDSGFLANNPQAEATLQAVATQMGDSISANLAAIAPAGGNTWSATFFDPATGAQTSVANLSVAANTITIFVGARALSSSEAGYGGFGGYSISGSPGWINTVQTRGWNGFSLWGGSVTFDTTQNWYFGQSAAGLGANQTDFYSVAEHELGHVLGIGTSNQWKALSSNGTFTGASATSAYGGPVPLTADGAHWANGVAVNGQHAVMDPILPLGTRLQWTALDAGALIDIGWGSASWSAPAPTPPPPPTPTPPPPPPPAAAARAVVFTGGTDGTLTMFDLVNGALSPTGRTFTPYVGYHGALRVAAGDFYGNGQIDYAVTTGTVGPQAVVEILSGADGRVLVPQTAIFPGFDGGLFLAAGHIDGNGADQLAVSADAGATPAVQTFQVVGDTLVRQASFYAFGNPTYSGGVRLAIGDINRDGFADLVAATGGQGLAAVEVYSGAALRSNVVTPLVGPFNPFPGYFGGLNVAAGDMTGAGFADLAVSPDAGAPAHVEVWSGQALSSGAAPAGLPVMASFYAFSPTDTSGARLAMVDLSGNGQDDLVATSENAQNSAARVFGLANFQTGNVNTPISYPIGTTTYAGLYAADHVGATDTNSSNGPTPNATGTDTNAPQPPASTASTASDAGTPACTVSSTPAPSGCTCPACMALARLLAADAAKSGHAATSTVM